MTFFTMSMFSFAFTSHPTPSRVIILEDELEKLMVSRETMEMTRVGYQELQDRLRFLQPHMQASASCWEETVAQVERMLCRATNCPGEGPAWEAMPSLTTHRL